MFDYVRHDLWRAISNLAREDASSSKRIDDDRQHITHTLSSLIAFADSDTPRVQKREKSSEAILSLHNCQQSSSKKLLHDDCSKKFIGLCSLCMCGGSIHSHKPTRNQCLNKERRRGIIIQNLVYGIVERAKEEGWP